MAAGAAWSIVKPRVIWSFDQNVRTTSALDRSGHPQIDSYGASGWSRTGSAEAGAPEISIVAVILCLRSQPNHALLLRREVHGFDLQC
jgi:hypothetical protein